MTLDTPTLSTKSWISLALAMQMTGRFEREIREAIDAGELTSKVIGIKGLSRMVPVTLVDRNEVLERFPKAGADKPAR